MITLYGDRKRIQARAPSNTFVLNSVKYCFSFFQPSISTEIDILQEKERKLNKILIFLSMNLK